jgi:hypothetical protein
MIVLYTSSELWRNHVLENGLASVVTIRQVGSKNIVIVYKAGTQFQQIMLSQPYPRLRIVEQFKMRYNKY